MIPITPPHWPQVGAHAMLRGKYRGAYSTSTGAESPSLARTFNGTDQDFEIADNADVSVGNIDFTILLWHKPADRLGFYGLLSKGRPDASGHEYEAFLFQTDGEINFRVRKADDSGVVSLLTSGIPAPAATWSTLEIAHDATNDKLLARVNGGTAQEAAIAGGVLDGVIEFRIGSLFETFWYKGSIARIGFWKRLLTADERTFLNAAPRRYTALTAGYLTSLAAYWDCEEASGNLIDAHGNNDLTANGSPGSGTGPP